MPLIEIAYGDDDATKILHGNTISLQNDAIKTIIVPTTIGLSSAAKALKESGKDVNLIGLGFPSELSRIHKRRNVRQIVHMEYDRSRLPYRLHA